MAIDTGFIVDGEGIILSKTEYLLLELLAEHHFGEGHPLYLPKEYKKAIENLWRKDLVLYELTPYDEYKVTLSETAIDLYEVFGYSPRNEEDTYESSVVETLAQALAHMAIEISLLRDELRKPRDS